MIEPGGLPVDFPDSGPELTHRIIHGVLGDIEACSLSKEPDGFHIIKIFYLHYKGDYIAAGAAAKAVKGAVVGVDIEGAGFFIMEGAQAHHILTPSF